MSRHPSFNRAVLQLVFGAAIAASASVHAESFLMDPESGVSVSAQSTLSRAEVLADLKVYQESGLATAERAAAETGQETPALFAARQRYAALRHGDRYAALVAEYAARRGETVRVAAKA